MTDDVFIGFVIVIDAISIYIYPCVALIAGNLNARFNNSFENSMDKNNYFRHIRLD